MKVGSPIISLNRINSTNDYALKLINDKKATTGMVVSAFEQTSGKGLESNTWESEAGKNLTISIIVKPKGLPPEKQFMLNKITALAVRDFANKMLKRTDVLIKWPNDIYMGNKKLSGILISNIIEGQAISWSVVGIGVNINQKIFRSDAPNPVSMIHASGREFNLDLCLKSLCDIFEEWFTQLMEKNHQKIDAKYLKAQYRLGVFSEFIFKNRLLEARITGIGEFGHLLLETTDGSLLSCDLKEVKYVL